MTGGTANVEATSEVERREVLGALSTKRSEISGKIEHNQMELRLLIAELDHVDATIRLFDPNADLASVGATPYPPRHNAFKGEMTRFVLAALKEASQPITSLEIAKRVMSGRALDPDDHGMTILMRRRVSACLWKLRDKGLARSIPMEGEYKGWELASKPPPASSRVVPIR